MFVIKEKSQFVLLRIGFDLVASIGFEPIQTEPESAVLPLHHKAF
jgi:hypothetical protein